MTPATHPTNSFLGLSAGRWLQAVSVICLVFIAGRVLVNQIAPIPGYMSDLTMTAPRIAQLVAMQFTRDLIQAVLIPGFIFVFLLGGRFAAGQIFTTENTKLISLFGWTLVAAFLTGFVIRPNLWVLLTGQDSSMPVMLYDPYFVIGGVGILIVIMARAMTEAVRLKEENQQFI